MTIAMTGEPATAEQFAERLFAEAVTTMETFSIHLGMTLGLYPALAEGKTDPRQLAERAGIHPRYAREWLEQQAAAGIVHVEEDSDDPYARVFTLPDGPREVLLDPDSPAYLGPLPSCMSSLGPLLPDLVTAYRTGGGIPYEAYGAAVRHGIAGMNRPMYRTQLDGWLDALPDIRQRLTNGPSRVLDLGCGTGASSVAIAELFPQAHVHGVDLDEASVAEARERAAQHGVPDRVTFARADGATLSGDDRYDLVCVFEALHDMADPVATLRTVRDLLAAGGAVVVGDERVGERLTPGDQVERLNYGFSVLHCLPATRAEGSAVEAGTVLRPGTVAEYAAAAGLAVTVLPVEHDLWRFYRFDPA